MADQNDRLPRLGDDLPRRFDIALERHGRILNDQNLITVARKSIVDSLPARPVDKGACTRTIETGFSSARICAAAEKAAAMASSAPKMVCFIETSPIGLAIARLPPTTSESESAHRRLALERQFGQGCPAAPHIAMSLT
jgi:hypothetical protein